MTSSIQHLRSLLLTAPLVMLAACGGGPTPGEEQAGILQPELKAGIRMTNSPHVCLEEFNCVRNEFGQRIRYWDGKADVPFELDSSRQKVKWVDLNAAVSALNANDPLGIRILYGLDDQNTSHPALRWALQPVILTQESQVFHAAQPIHDKVWVVANDGTLSNSDTLIWQGGAQANYLNKVRIRRDAYTKFAPLEKGEDPRSYTFLWNDIEALHSLNGGPEFIRINAIASPNVRRYENGKWYEADWMHRLAITALDGGDGDILTNQASSDLKDRALELGTPCPPRCKKYLQHQYGQLPHSDCTCP